MIFSIGSSPLKFTMCECIEKNEIKNLIETNGGIFLNDYTKGVILLLPYDISFIVKDHSEYEPVSYKFIYDSIALQNLQPIENYLLGVVKTNQTTYTVRVPYTEQEDKGLSQYVLTHFGNPNNVSYWINYKNETGSMRTIDSLRSHWKILIKRHAFNQNSIVKENYYKNDLRIKPMKPYSIVYDHPKTPNSDIIEMSRYCNENFESDSKFQLRYKNSANYICDGNQRNQRKTKKKKDEDGLHLKKIQEINEDAKIYPYTEIKLATDNDIPLNIDYQKFPNRKTENIELSRTSKNTVIKRKIKNYKEMDDNRIEELFENLVEICKIRTNTNISPHDIAKALISFQGNVHNTINFFVSSTIANNL